MTRKPRRDSDYQKATRLIHGQHFSAHWNYDDHIIPPISASVAYRLETAERGAAGFQSFANPEFNRSLQQPIYIYDRLDEPSRSMLEDNLAMSEDGEVGVCFSTGMAAISAAIGVLARAGDRVLAHQTLYGCTYSLLENWLPRFGMSATFVDFKDPAALERALGPDVMVVYLETPTNPTLELIDLGAIRAAVDRVNATRGAKRKVFIVVDNTFASPWGQRPLTLGADVVVHSLTKSIGGFGTDMGGVVIGPRILEPDLLLFRKDFGASLAPRSAWSTLVHGLPTLPIRLRQQMQSAGVVASFLQSHPAVEHVRYPGLKSHPQHQLALKQLRDPDGKFAPGILIYFVLKGAPEQARDKGRRMMDFLANDALAITLAVSLGQLRSLIEHPASMTHAAIPPAAQAEAGIDPGGIRISVGLEAPEDIIRDLRTALESI